MKLEAQKREIIGKKTKNLRKENLVPGVLFGPKRTPLNVQVDKKTLEKLYTKVGHSKFFDLQVGDSSPVKVLINEIARHPLKDIYLNVNFYQVAEDRKITVEVPITFIGESPAIKQNLGFLITSLESIEVHCLPKDLPTELVVDLGVLQNTGDAVTVENVKLPENVELDSGMEPTTAIVYIAAAQKEEVEEVVAVEPELDAEGNPIVVEGAAEAGEATEGAEETKGKSGQ